jgi:hypothetical protein
MPSNKAIVRAPAMLECLLMVVILVLLQSRREPFPGAAHCRSLKKAIPAANAAKLVGHLKNIKFCAAQTRGEWCGRKKACGSSPGERFSEPWIRAWVFFLLGISNTCRLYPRDTAWMCLFDNNRYRLGTALVRPVGYG